MTEPMTPKEMRLEAAQMLLPIIPKQQTLRWCKQQVAKMVPGQVVLLNGEEVSREMLEWIIGDIEAEIKPVQEAARALQDRANGKVV